ncbi:tRNA delta(2)-isopentenylpyrophosphate transferase [Desulfarculus baarsii DSM 2075]|uniref:tRNA dimethylallyltransferase n=1 Tax=Desulfarculus baarsii (strain ATCC 33931 / DSM 2075 / LMG 7858 / VKM B-1802 / 2st14) TaxID=644282 RepID=E1QF60_DESB2|nr:tRNA (adenosine(37)-N6)-dimethylallyltransferase MiaA [Desulfarculus baarsii]ADK84196.1 tRNA delta(2)-isopentenylpyrophosphate transferase [Desulfarculus baarsii DSM 2075]
MSGRPPLLVVVGPTAVGKTGLAIALAQALDAEIVSADSVQVYRGLDVGSAKPTAREQAQARHHLLDVADPAEPFSAARYVELADQAIADIASRGKRALVVGGTGLYVRALLHGLAPAPPAAPELREELRAQWQELGPLAMHRRLAELDAQSAARLHPNDRQRVLRALEVCLGSGRPMSAWQASHRFGQRRYEHLTLGLDRQRQQLYQRIEERGRQMWAEGLLEEARAALAAGASPQAHGLDSLGYRQAVALILGRLTPEQAVAETIKQTKAYAKRQLTWFRGLEGINWLSADDLVGALALARRFFGL